MPTNIAVITQVESEHKVLPKANPTMALPILAPTLVPQFPKKKVLQMALWGNQAPKPDFIQDPSHDCGSSKVQTYKYYPTPAKPHGSKKKRRSSNQKRRQDKPNILAFTKPKMTARRVFSWHTLCTSRS